MLKNYSPATHIIVKGARQHNLKNIDAVIPKNQLVVFTGLSGSGKSSFVFDTIYAEGQRRYIESLSAYARQFLGVMQKPDVDRIDGLSPAISIDQKTTSHNPRSTVGTITEIYDYLRLLFARIGHPHCPNCNREISIQSNDQIVDQVIRIIKENSLKTPSRWLMISPIVREKKGEFNFLFQNLKKQGFDKIRIDQNIYSVNEDILLIKTNRHTIGIILDRITVDNKLINNSEQLTLLKTRLRQTVAQALELSDVQVVLSHVKDSSLVFPEKPMKMIDYLFSQDLACPKCNINIPVIEPRFFSFNTPYGACPKCTGLGSLLKIDLEKLVAIELTIAEGAIIPLASAMSSNSWYANQIKSVLIANNSAANIPWVDLDNKIKEIILYGDKSRKYETKGINQQGNFRQYDFFYEGVINNLERRYQDTNSDFMRGEIERYMRKEVCPECKGSRLKKEVLSVSIDKKSIVDIVRMPIYESLEWINRLFGSTIDEMSALLSKNEKKIAYHITKEIKQRLNFLKSVGLEYLTLHREAGTLAGGEAQRIRLASQIGTGLTGVLYVLDEPTIGLHPRDNERLIKTMKSLRDLGNSLLVVEHDREVMKAADYILDFGPKAGNKGGQIINQGNYDEFINDPNSLTAKYLNNELIINERTINRKRESMEFKPQFKRKKTKGMIVLRDAKIHNLKNITVKFPLSKLCVVTGVSGSGKSSLIHDTLYPAIKHELNPKLRKPAHFGSVEGVSQISMIKLIDQNPIGRTPRSNPGTYTKVFDFIRELMANSYEAKLKGYKPGRFSFNVKGGRCESCNGDGHIRISMQFLADVYVDCEVCKGKRYNSETLGIKYKDKNIAEILDLTIDSAIVFFSNQEPIIKKLRTLQAVGLGYITLGQMAPTLSGGEAQRVKLAKELSTVNNGHCVYLLDEPTTGLHFEDIKNLLVVLYELVNANNTVIVIEHNMEVIKNADWIIDLGPDGGEKGGELVTAGSIQDVIACNKSYTGQYLKNEIK